MDNILILIFLLFLFYICWATVDNFANCFNDGVNGNIPCNCPEIISIGFRLWSKKTCKRHGKWPYNRNDKPSEPNLKEVRGG